jgi:ATP-dependent DNA ligase
MKTWSNKLDPLYNGLPYMEIEGEAISYPCVAEVKLDGEFQYIIERGGIVYLANKQKHGRIRTGMPVTNIEIPKDSIFLGELVWGAGTDFYDFARHKLDPNCNLGVFGCVQYMGKQLWGKVTYKETRDLLEAQTFYNKKVALIPAVMVQDGKELEDLFKKVVSGGYEGLVLKQLNSKYINGKTIFWTKKKYQTEADLVVLGYQTGTKRAKNLSILVGHLINGEIKPITHVGGGFKYEEKMGLLKALLKCPVIGKDKDDVLVAPKLVVKIIYNGVIKNPDGSISSLRHPRFDRFRLDKTVDEVDTIK